MKNLIKCTILSVAVLALASGCQKEFLDREVPGGFSEADFYKSDADAIQATAAVYDMMQAHYNSNWTSMYMVKTLLSDESNAGGSGPGDQPQYQALDDFQIDAENGGVESVWRVTYFTIYRANKVINNVKAESPIKIRSIAEAKTLRAYAYFDLVSLWGDVPLITEDVAPSAYTSTKRAGKAAIWAQIEKDLTEAIPNLPLKSTYSAAEKFRVAKGTAQALLGKAYLYQQKWAQAAASLNDVITSGQYSLEPSVGIVFSNAGEFGKESLLEVSYSNNRNYDWGNFPWGGQPESNIHVQLMGPRSDFYTKAPADSLIGGWGFNTPKAKLYNAYVAAGDVQRRRNTVMSEAELKAAGGNWTQPTAYDYEGFFQRKYGTFDKSTGGPVGELNYSTNWRLIRYADVLLMAAEANYRNNNEGVARQYLNDVRRRSGLGDVNATGPALFTAIVNERFLELAFEGHRYMDLVRWGLAAQELGPLGYQAKNSLLPIPGSDVRTSGITQNPGY